MKVKADGQKQDKNKIKIKYGKTRQTNSYLFHIFFDHHVKRVLCNGFATWPVKDAHRITSEGLGLRVRVMDSVRISRVV